MKILNTKHGEIKLPTFFPDGTLGVVRGVDATDLRSCQVEGLVINAYHLLVNSVADRLENFGDIHTLMNWDRPIITDSGGFQVMSLVHKNPKLGKIKDDQIIFYGKELQKIYFVFFNCAGGRIYRRRLCCVEGFSTIGFTWKLPGS